jgi:hypothetical protein
MVILIFGSRSWTNFEIIQEELFRAVWDADDLVSVIHGGAKGADSLGGKAAKAIGIEPTVVRPNYAKYGRWEAPKKRNIEMADMKPDLALCFWDGISGGTMHMLQAVFDRTISVNVRFSI